MSRITANQEELLAAARSRNRQNKETPFLIRDDGVLVVNTPLNFRNKRCRPYHGDANAPLAERMAFIRGEMRKRKVTYNPADDQPFDLNRATKDDVLMFAQDEYGVILDPTKSLSDLKKEVYALSQAEVEGGMGQGIGVNRPGGDATGTNRNVTAGTGTVNAGHFTGSRSSAGRGLQVDADDDQLEQRDETGRPLVVETRKVEEDLGGNMRGQQQALDHREQIKEANADAPRGEKTGTSPVKAGSKPTK